MHDDRRLSGGSPMPGPAVGVSTEIATVSVLGISQVVQKARVGRVASAPGPGGNPGSGVTGQGKPILRRPRPC
jgi:hypothetical protein